MESQLPAGTVTFLFTDIQGSTALLKQLGEQYIGLLADQRRILRSTIAKWGGQEVDTQGDSFFVSFSQAAQAVAAVVEIQQAMAAFDWPSGVAVQIRMGLHTGEPWLAAEGYVGLDVHRAARLAHIGYGGQVLLSETTTALVQDALPPGVSLLDLGEVHLKDMPRPERTYQLAIAGLPADFPPLKRLLSPPNNLPAQTTPFIGREQELVELDKLLSDRDVRLVTLLGAGGMGKTRLALAAAEEQHQVVESMDGQLTPRFPQGVFLVSLASLEAVEALLPAIAQAVDFKFYPGAPPMQQLQGFFQERQVLLVMDNFEHLLAGATFMSHLLAGASRLKILVTSRHKLNLRGEIVFLIEGLPFPGEHLSGEAFEPQASSFAAIDLFVQSARRASPAFEPTAVDRNAIARICQQMAGMPLGIELAAAWVELLTPGKIADEIQGNLDFLETEQLDAPERHQSMRAVFDYSWNLLGEAEREVFTKLSVFRGGFSREAAQVVVGASLHKLHSLVRKSLVQRDPVSGRYEIHNMLRMYAGMQLEATGTVDSVRNAHCAYYSAFLGDRLGEMLGPNQVSALDEIEAEFRNVHQAWHWAVEQKDYAAIDQASESLFVFSDMRSWEHEGVELFGLVRERFAPQPEEEPNATWGRNLLPWYDLLLQSKGAPENTDVIRSQAETCLAFARKRGDQLGMAHGMILLGYFLEPAEALKMYEQALELSPRLDDSFWVRIRMGFCLRSMGEYGAALNAFQRSYQRGQEIAEKEKMGWSLYNIGETEMFLGDFANALPHLREAKSHFSTVGTVLGILWTTLKLSFMMLLTGHFDEARSLFAEAQETASDANRSPAIKNESQMISGYLALVEGNYQQAQDIFEGVLSATTTSPECSLGLTFAACGLGVYTQAIRHLKDALIHASAYRTRALVVLCLPAAALILVQEGEAERAVALLALATGHPISLKELLNKWSLTMQLHTELETMLTPDIFEAAWGRGQVLDLTETLTMLTDHFQDVVDDR